MSEWKTQRYEGSVGVDGRWVVSRSEAEARVEAAERERDEAIKARDEWESPLEATLAAVREFAEEYRGKWPSEWWTERLLALLDGEGRKYPEAKSTERKPGPLHG